MAKGFFFFFLLIIIVMCTCSYEKKSGNNLFTFPNASLFNCTIYRALSVGVFVRLLEAEKGSA